MCGIAGRLAVDGANASESAVARSLQAMRHRGPDDLVTWSRPGVDLAHAASRSSTARTATSRCSRGDGRYAVVFNGEIYNHQALRKELLEAGCRLSTTA